MMKKESIAGKIIDKVHLLPNRTAIVISSDTNQLPGSFPHCLDPRQCFVARGATVNNVPDQHHPFGLIAIEQISHALLDGRHAPHREQSTIGPAGNLVAKVNIRQRQPAARSVPDGQPPIERHFVADSCCGSVIWADG